MFLRVFWSYPNLHKFYQAFFGVRALDALSIFYYLLKNTLQNYDLIAEKRSLKKSSVNNRSLNSRFILWTIKVSDSGCLKIWQILFSSTLFYLALSSVNRVLRSIIWRVTPLKELILDKTMRTVWGFNEERVYEAKFNQYIFHCWWLLTIIMQQAHVINNMT